MLSLGEPVTEREERVSVPPLSILKRDSDRVDAIST